jgi:hypothetical protein
MAKLRDLLSGPDLGEVQTCIQSGKAVFASDLDAPTLGAMIRPAVAARFGFAPETFVLTARAIAEALTDHPFQTADPARVHVFSLALPGDGWQIGRRRFTLQRPDGIGRSTLAANLPLPALVTARTLRTIAALSALAG